jgi:S1-C subfamily serine protease
LVFVPFDDGDDDDTPVGGAPLPPDDRLWRHPSELGLPAAPALTGSATASEASSTRLWAVAVVAGLIGSALSLGVVAVAGGLTTDVAGKPGVERVAVRPMAELSLASSSGQGIIAIAKSVAPAIARIESTAQKGKALASAILVRTDGYLATNAHLVTHITTVLVVLSDGTELAGRVVGTDMTTDIAILKVDRDDAFSVATLGSATDLQPGQAAIAIGSPLGPAGGPSVTVGVISALGRRVNSSDGIELHDMIQTDAPTAVGSSGGALCDGSGSVIGMTTAISTSTDPGANALGYAIPVDIVRAVADDIIATGSARHSWLGVEGADLDPTNAKDIGITGGAKVTKVADDSPASLAGLKSDDVIVALDGSKVTSMSAFVVALRGHHPGDAITLQILRGSDPQTMTVTLGEKNHA